MGVEGGRGRRAASGAPRGQGGGQAASEGDRGLSMAQQCMGNVYPGCRVAARDFSRIETDELGRCEWLLGRVSVRDRRNFNGQLRGLHRAGKAGLNQWAGPCAVKLALSVE